MPLPPFRARTARRRSPLALLSALAAALLLALAVPGVSFAAPLAGSTFEGDDGNQVDGDGALGPLRDWQNVVGSATSSTDATGTGSEFGGGTKETVPGEWAFVSEPVTGVNPGKSDIIRAWSLTEQGAGATPSTFLNLAFVRNDVSGNTFLTFELNQRTSTWTNGVGTVIPCRTDGDVLISYEVTPGGDPVDIRSYFWNGSGGTAACPDGATGTFTGGGELTDGPTPLAQGAMNFGDPHGPADGDQFLSPGQTFAGGSFGEASINLTAVFAGAGLDPCFSFGQIQMHSRSAVAIDSQLQDFVAPVPLLVRSCTASGTKFHDQDADGQRDAGEPGLAGWTIYADLNGDGDRDPGEPFAVTGTGGGYTITGVPNGVHAIREEQQTGWTCSYPSADPLASPPRGNCSYTATFTGGNVGGLDFGNYRDAEVSGRKYEDLNADGDRDAGEPFLNGWRIYVDENGNGAFDAGEPTDVTATVGGEDGRYRITGIRPSATARKVREVQQAGWTCSEPATTDADGCFRALTFLSGDSRTGDFGNYRDAVLRGQKFEDRDADGTKDAGEPGLEGWQIRHDNGTPNDTADDRTTTTDAQGDYSFTVRPGRTYRITETQKAGWTCSAPDPCRRDATPSSGQTVSGLDFGNYRDAEVSGRKYEDLNADGDRDAGEPFLNGWRIYVDENGNGAFDAGEPTDVTATVGGEDGRYRITGIRPSATARKVREVQQTAWRCTEPATADADGCFRELTLLSGSAPTGDFGNHELQSSTVIVKAGNEFAYHGDTLTFDFTVTNPGETALSDVTITDDRCANVQGPTAKRRGAGADPTPATLDPGDSWTFTCSMPVPGHSAGEANPLVNTATVRARDEFGRPVSDSDQHQTRILHPAIDIDKTGPETAQAGDDVTYTLAVTNPGDVSFAEANVALTDERCATAPALQSKLRGGGPDPTPARLDPGDTWTYTCVARTQVGDTEVVNVGRVDGTDDNGRKVNDTDDARTVLSQPQRQVLQAESGSARIVARRACVSRSFSARIAGRQIARVVFTIDGRRVKTLTRPDSAGRWLLKVDPRRYAAGRTHRLVARVTFTEASGTPPRTLRVSFRRCARRAVSFTG